MLQLRLKKYKMTVMKRIYFLLVFLMASGSIFSQLLTENFEYTEGQALTANTWTAHSAAGTNAITVVSPGLTYTGHPGSGVGNAASMINSGEDVNKAFSGPVTSGSVYASFLVNFSVVQTGDYFTGFFQSSSVFPVRVYAKTDGAGGFFFGVSKGSSAAVYETNSRSLNTTYMVVLKYTFNTGSTTDDEINLWVNPALGGTETTATIAGVTSTGGDATTIGAIMLRQGSAASAPTQKVDAILAGTTWEAVTPSATVPVLNTTALTAFGNVCINITAGPNSFDITGANLTTDDITVGALAGFTYATTAGGTYSNTLAITQPGGSFAQTVYVKFDPTLVQAYDGSIPVAGGGVSTAVNVAASGAGVNNAPAVTSGTATAITQVSATVSGSITDAGCSPISSYGIEYSTTSGFANGTGINVPASNLASGDFSADLTGLTTATTYYYHAWATNAAGTTYGTEGTFTTATPDPQIMVSALTAFGDICINTSAGPNSFTISGANLTTADITVGALNGYSFSTTSGGTYTSSLVLTQTGGTYSQEIFVQFNPAAVQSYDGNIQISGGGIAAPVDVPATGSGVNAQPGLTTGTVSAITFNSATLAGTITTTGCTAVTAYGVEYSTTNNFTPGSGTQVSSSDLSGGNFTAALAGLAPVTVYYFRAWATNDGGTAYGLQQSFTTAAVPISLTATPLTAFGSVCVNTSAGPNSFTINGAYLTSADISVGPLNGYSFATTSGGTYSSTLTLTQPGGTYSQTVYVKFDPLAVQAYNGNIRVTGGGFATPVNVAASGAGVNTVASVSSGVSSNITTQSATAAGLVVTNGCSAVTAYGIEYSGINNFTPGTGTKVPASNLSSGNFTADLTGLVQGATYYYRAYATNNGGTAYGDQQSFTVLPIGNGYRLYPNPAERGTAIRVTVTDVKPGYYGVILMNAQGEKVYQWNMNIQSSFINQQLQVPATLARGVYRAYLVNYEKELGVITLLVL